MVKTPSDLSLELRRAQMARGPLPRDLQSRSGLSKRVYYAAMTNKPEDFSVRTLLTVADYLQLDVVLVPRPGTVDSNGGLKPEPTVMSVVDVALKRLQAREKELGRT